MHAELVHKSRINCKNFDLLRSINAAESVVAIKHREVTVRLLIMSQGIIAAQCLKVKHEIFRHVLCSVCQRETHTHTEKET